MTLTIHIFIFECLVRLIEPYVCWSQALMDGCFNLFVLSCAGSFCLGFTGTVGVKNIPNHNNYVPLGQLRDLTAL